MEVSLIKVASPFGGVGVKVSKLKLLCLRAKTYVCKICMFQKILFQLRQIMFVVTETFSFSHLPVASEATYPVDVVQQWGLVGCAVLQRRHGDGFQQQTQGNGHAPVQQAEQQRHHQLTNGG